MRAHARLIACLGLAVLAVFCFAQEGQSPGPPEGQPPEDGGSEGGRRSILAVEGHQMGDQTLALSAGLSLPLFFQDFQGGTYDTNLSLGGAGTLQWNAYLSPVVRMGLEIGGAFSRSPNDRTLFIMPVTFKAAYLFSISRFEFPVYLGAGVAIVRYREWSHLDLILKPGVAAYWRYDSNWSFGLAMEWWLDFQPTTEYQPADQARMGHFLLITPSVFYNF